MFCAVDCHRPGRKLLKQKMQTFPVVFLLIEGVNNFSVRKQMSKYRRHSSSDGETSIRFLGVGEFLLVQMLQSQCAFAIMGL